MHHPIPEDSTLHGNCCENLRSYIAYSLYTEVVFLTIARYVNNGKCTEHSEVGDHTTVKMVGQVGETAHTSHWACTGASTLITDKALILLVAQNKPPNYQNSHNKSHLYLKKHGSMN